MGNMVNTPQTPQSAPQNNQQVPGGPPGGHVPGQVPPSGQVPASPQEDPYMDKLKQLRRYIEPLTRLINKKETNPDSKQDVQKMRHLRDILIGQNRVTITILEKENGIEKFTPQNDSKFWKQRKRPKNNL